MKDDLPRKRNPYISGGGKSILNEIISHTYGGFWEFEFFRNLSWAGNLGKFV